MEGKSKSHCKIRKRGCSSSSSSSLVRRYRLKRAILVGKKTGSSTPVPTWKVGAKSPPLVVPDVNSMPSGEVVKGKEGLVSVRKLGATLWEINEVQPPTPKKGAMDEEKMMLRRRDKGGRLSHSGSMLPRLSDPTHSLPERMDQYGSGKHQRRASISSQKLQLTECIVGGLESASNASVVEIEAPSRNKNRAGGPTDMKTRIKDLGNSLTTSKELLKVLYRVGGFAKHHPSSISIISALKVELDRACSQVEELSHDQRAYQNEIDFLARNFAEEKAAWRSKERDRVRNAIAHMAEELEVEKKLRRQTERLNKKLGKELADTKATLGKLAKELEGEKRAKDILEQVCDELARGIGEDRAQVEELKRESAKVIEEVEKEREMLQLADVLREERVQMKLSEAKYHFEEKNAAVERLRNELENYLRSKAGEEEDNSPTSERSKKLEALLMGGKNVDYDNFPLAHDDAGNEEEDGSGDSDLHSIELNMDNGTRSYKWSYVNGIDDGQEANGPRRSLSEIQWGSISLKKEPANGTSTELGSNTSENLNGFNRGRLLEFVSQAQRKNNEDETSKRNRGSNSTTKGVKDHKAIGFGVVSLQPVASPIRKWGQSFPLQDPFREDRENSPMVLSGNDLKSETTAIEQVQD